MSARMNIPQAIARMEGFGKPGTRPTDNNNPGDIEWGKFAQAHGADRPEHGVGRFAHFPSAETGFAAMRALLQSAGYKGLTIRATLNKWAPPVENDDSAYLAGVLRMTGLTADTIIDGYLG